MRFHGGMHGLITSPDEKPKITRQLLMRVLHYARPYRLLILTMLVLILGSTGLSLLTPLILLASLVLDRKRTVHDLLLGTAVIRSDR